ncbi:MAG: ABC transporter ATP-binding protein [Bacteroidales bacterium]
MLRVEGISKTFDKFSLNAISFSVNAGDYFMLLGPSGAGKSMILEILAGLVSPDKGDITLNDENITLKPIGGRGIGLVFQDYAVFPHMTVSSNIAYPLRRKGLKGKMLHRRVLELAERVSVSHLLDRKPETLSGGELQRTALARTLALEPKLLLLDEPLSSVDAELRADLRSLLRRINTEGATIIHVTHDFEEAIALASRVAVVNNGNIEQCDTAQEIFQNPRSMFVAKFTGIRNFYPASILETTEHGLRIIQVGGKYKICGYTDQLEGTGFVYFPESAVNISTDVQNQSALNVFKGKIVELFPQKFGYEVAVDVGFRVMALVTWESVNRMNLKEGAAVWVSFKANSLRFVPKA